MPSFLTISQLGELVAVDYRVELATISLPGPCSANCILVFVLIHQTTITQAYPPLPIMLISI